MARILYWFRNTLRVEDLLPFQPEPDDTLFGCYVLDERNTSSTPIEKMRMGPKRKDFLLNGLHVLNQEMVRLGGNLIFKEGNVVKQILQLVTELQIDTFIYNEELGTEEINDSMRIHLALQIHGVRVVQTQLNYFSSFPDVPFDIVDTPKIFTVFRKKLEQHGAFQMQSHFSPQKWDAHASDPIPHASHDSVFESGCIAGKKRVLSYIHETQLVRTYKETRNELLGMDFSTKFSPYLAFGFISPVQIHKELVLHEQEFGENDSTYWIKFELLWRDFFRYVFLQHESKIFQASGIGNKSNASREDLALFEKWRTGNTGDDFVDANMIELLQTGYMSNRGRQNVASFLVHQYQIDWRWGAWWFEHQLVDYDVCSNWGNWLYLAGVGNDPRENRVFNTQKQARDYDPQGKYRAYWLEKR
ncbi:MAG: DASH family cryptochrome [Bacteroidota bacterium]